MEELTNQELVKLRKETSDPVLKLTIKGEFKRRQLLSQDGGNGLSSHHMWSMPEIRNQLKKIHGDTWTAKQYREETKKIHSMIPVYKIPLKHHRYLHGHKSGIELSHKEKI